MKKFFHLINEHVEEVFISVMMGYFVVATVLQIVFRFVLHLTTAWTEETAIYAFIWMTFVGSALGAKTQSHIRVDMLEMGVKGAAKTALNLFSQVVFLLFAVILTVVGVQMLQSLAARPQASPALKIPMQAVYAAMPVGMGLMAIRITVNLVLKIRALAAGTVTDGAAPAEKEDV